MNEEFFIKNGLLKKTIEPIFNCNNRAFLYGDGFFESIYAFNEKIPFLKFHVERILNALNVFNFDDISLFQNVDELSNMIVYLARKNKLYKAYRVRITIFRSSGGLYRPKSNKANFIIQISKLPYDEIFYDNKGVKIDLYNDIYKDYSILSPFKIISPFSVLAMNFASNNNIDDVLFVNHKSNIVESSNSNVFIYHNNILYTPNINEGCVNGIMRHIIILEAQKMGIIVIESDLNVDSLFNAQEVFLTNAVNGIRFVSAFRSKRYYNSISKKLFNSLIESFF